VTRALPQEMDDEIDGFSLRGGNHQLGTTRRALPAAWNSSAGGWSAGSPNWRQAISTSSPTPKRPPVGWRRDARQTHSRSSMTCPPSVRRPSSTRGALSPSGTAGRRGTGRAGHSLRGRTPEPSAPGRCTPSPKAASSRELAELVETGLLPEQVVKSTGTSGKPAGLNICSDGHTWPVIDGPSKRRAARPLRRYEPAGDTRARPPTSSVTPIPR
jgi:hypothetical protein